MKKSYDLIMEKLVVDDKMRQSVIANIQNADKSKHLRLYAYKKYFSIAACLTVLLVGTVLLPQIFNSKLNAHEPIVTKPVHDIVEYTSLEELSKAVGFAIYTPAQLPFEVTKTEYSVYRNTLAQIAYSGDGQSAKCRMSEGQDDNSGDYTVYEANKEINTGIGTITLKGSDGVYSLAVWTDDTYSYSVRLAKGVREDEWRTLVGDVK